MNRDIDKITMSILRASHPSEQPGGVWRDDRAVLAAPMSDLDFDSLDKLEFVMNIEDTFKIMLDENEIEKCTTLADLTTLIGKTLAATNRC